MKACSAGLAERGPGLPNYTDWCSAPELQVIISINLPA